LVKTTVKGRDKQVRRRNMVPFLRVLFSPGADKLPELQILKRVVVGRVPEADVQLPNDERLSRRHAVIEIDTQQTVRVTDSSANGVFLDGKQITESAIVGDGAILRLGDSLLLLRYRDTVEKSEQPLPRIVGDSPAIARLARLVRQVAPTDATVLVLGETGTGKDLVARALYELGAAKGAFVPVNCAAIAESLAESALFGHVTGAFTGAKESPGYFRAADGGVLFLDEVGELSATMQARLLRAIEDKVITPVGSVQPIATHTRVIAATNRNLGSSVAAGTFRGDLYARLAEVMIVTPPLRDRREDILPIFLAALGPGAAPLSPELAEALLLYAWPFNVRELVKIAADIKVRGAGLRMLDVDLIEDRIRLAAETQETPPMRLSSPPASASGPASGERRAPPEREELVRLLEEHAGSVADIARVTGRSRKQVYRWLEDHGLDADAYRR
jgi:DNA-binding NtrC family response regulator